MIDKLETKEIDKCVKERGREESWQNYCLSLKTKYTTPNNFPQDQELPKNTQEVGLVCFKIYLILGVGGTLWFSAFICSNNGFKCLSGLWPNGLDVCWGINQTINRLGT